MFSRLALASLLSILATTAPALAAEELVAGITLPPSSLAAPSDTTGLTIPVARSSKATYANASPAVIVDFCGVEAYGTKTDLDAGLLDYNVPDAARAAGHAADEPQDQGRNVRDYRYTPVFGVTVGYHF